MQTESVHVVVLGGGFGGLTFCSQFSHPGARVTLVDRTNHHLFQPLLYQVAMAGLSAPDIAQPIRSILANRPRLEVVLDEVQSIDLDSKQVVCARKTFSYDYLVLALGSVTSYFGHTEWEKCAPGLKTLEDALSIRRDVLLAFEQAENESDPNRQARLMTIVVVGGGPTGVELAGACAELAHRVLRRDFDHIDPTRARIILIEAAPRILGQFPPDLSESARQQLAHLGVDVRTSSPVKDISPGQIALANGEVIEAGNILWAAGVMAHPLARTLGADLDRAGRIKVEPDLSLPSHPEVFAIGDLVSLMRENGAPVPGVAPAAIQMAQHVARLIRKELDQGGIRLRAQSGGAVPLNPREAGPLEATPATTETASSRAAFRYRDKGNLATIGRSAGIAQIGKLKLRGFPAWLAWLVVHLIFLIGFRNKIAVLVSWTYSYFTYKLGARIITGWPPKPDTAESPD